MKYHLGHRRPQPLSPFAALLVALLVLLTGAWLALGAFEAEPSFAATMQQQTVTIKLTPFATGVSQPVKITNAGDDRLFVVQQSGEIRIVQPDGTVLTTPFLDISSRVISGGERGLLGLAFEPNNPTVFYVNYTLKSTDSQQNGDTIIARYRVTGSDPNVADPDSEEIVIQIDQPYSNHNAGDLAFGPDELLYIPMGDGGGGGDPDDNAQDLNTLLGKLLRIDVRVAVISKATYEIPPGNPYADEIWAIGLRNPWRFSFDRQTGDLYLGDVGQGAWEEINFQPANSTGGKNYGWDCREGSHPYRPSEQSPLCNPNGSYVEPIFEYSRDNGCSVTGGYVYRGTAYPTLVGHYILADYCSGNFWSLVRNSQDQWVSTAHGKLMNSPSTFGEDKNGELYVAGLSNGIIYRVAAELPAVTPTVTVTLVPTTTLVPTIPPDQEKRLYLPYIANDGNN